MAENYKLSLTAEEIDETLQKAGNAVLFTEQSLTDTQKQQVRENINAVNVADQPVSQSILSEHLTWDGQSELGYSQISTNFYNYNQMQNIEITLQNADNYKIILEYCKNAEELNASIDKNLAEGESGLFFMKGSFFFLSTTSLVGLYVPNKNLELASPLIVITDSNAEFQGSQLNIGTYFYSNENNVFVSDLKFNYKVLIYNEDFKEIFKDPHASNVYAMDVEALLSESEMGPETFQVLMAEFNKYKPGSILTVPSVIIQFLEGFIESGGG